MEHIRIKKQDGFLVALMPNGDQIPVQDQLKIENNTGDKGHVVVTFTCHIPIKSFVIEEEPDSDAK